MYYVGKFDESKFAVSPAYAQHSRGYERVSLVDHTVGSVHMGVGISQLQPKGVVESCVHAYETGIYVLEGELEMMRGQEAFRLSADDFALIPYGMSHTFRNSGTKRARWFEMQAPQPKPAGGWQDTFFEGDAEWPAQIDPPDLEDPRTRLMGHFKDQKPTIYGQAGTSGLTVRRFIDDAFGAQHFYVMRGELAVGGSRGLHDHPIEESYLVFSGEADIEIEGERFRLRAGDVAWTGVGAAHAFYQKGNETFRWIETQAPQFPVQNGFREFVVWERLRSGKK